jgi:fibronectin type 3 domain-containing protein
MWDSGASGTTMTDTLKGSRCPDISYAGSPLSSGVKYYWRIKFWDQGGEEGAWSDTANFTMAVATTPTAPQNLQATAGNQEVTLTWDAPTSDGGSAITNYKIYRGTTSGGETFLVQVGNVLTYTDTGLTNGQTYYY